ncbi:hypothetical protein SOVF_082290 [Spinacia oleracea]|nr:hypothetical protein SOVF_082290 [Spinacia oleracea]
MVSDKKKAILEELMLEARDKASLEPEVGGVKGEVVTRCIIFNRDKNRVPLEILYEHNWSGNPVPSYPPFIFNEMHPAQFKHQGTLPQGSKGGFVYADRKSFPARKWLVAFDIPKNKVYVEAGPIGPVDWNVVEVKLNASENSSYHEDPVFGGVAEAGIYNGQLNGAFTN